MPSLAQRLSGATKLIALALVPVLAGCVINSSELLVDEADATTPLPATFAMSTYSDSGDGEYSKSEKAPMTFTLDDKTYTSADGETRAMFEPLDDDSYLMTIKTENGFIYGVADFDGDIADLHVVLGDASGNTDVQALQSIPGVSITEGGVIVADRAALDGVIAQYLAGKLTLDSLVAFVGSEPPAKLTRSGDGWVME